MHRDDSEAMDLDRLDRALDALAEGGSPAAEPWLDATDLRLRALDTAFAPRDDVLIRIWNGLVEESAAPVVSGIVANGTMSYPPPRDWRVVYRWLGRRVGFAGGAVSEPGGHGGPPLHGRVDDAEAGHWWRRWGVGEASTVALLILVLIAGYTAMRLAGIGGSDGDEAGPGGFAAATAASDELIVPPEECTVEPRPLSFFEQFVATPSGSDKPHALFEEIDPADMAAVEIVYENGKPKLKGDEPADQTAIREIEATLRQLAACSNAGDPLRSHALFTDDLLTRAFTDLGGLAPEELVEIGATPTARPQDSWQSTFPIVEARVLENGHIAALLEDAVTNAEPTSENGVGLMIFERTGDRWLIHGFTAISPPTDLPPTPTPAGPSPMPEPTLVIITPTPAPTTTPLVAIPTGSLRGIAVPIAEAGIAQIVPTRTEAVVEIPGTAIAPVVESVVEPVAESVVVVDGRSIEQEPITVSLEVDEDGVIAGEPAAVEEATEALRQALADLPAECSIAYVFTEGHVATTADGNALANAVNDLLREQFPDLFGRTTLVSMAFFSPPVGKIELRLYVFEGCREAATVKPTPTNAAFRPTHQSNSANQVNLRAGPSTNSDFVKVLVLAEPLQYLNEDEPADDPSRDGPRWMKFRTEDGQVGWVREIDVEPIDGPMPTPAM